MNEKQETRLEKIRRKGMWNFVLKYGVCGFGGFAIIASTLLDLFKKKEFVLDTFLFNANTWLITGVAWGFVMWVVFEHQYKKTLSEKQQNAQLPDIPTNTSFEKENGKERTKTF